MSVDYFSHYKSFPRSILGPPSRGRFTYYGYQLHPKNYPLLFHAFSGNNLNIRFNNNGKLLSQLDYAGRTLWVDDFSYIPAGDSIYIPPGFCMILAQVAPDHSTTWLTYGTSRGIVYRFANNPNHSYHYFFIIFRWCHFTPYPRLYLYNLNYTNNMINQHYPHRSRSHVLQTRKSKSLKVKNILSVFSSKIDFPYY